MLLFSLCKIFEINISKALLKALSITLILSKFKFAFGQHSGVIDLNKDPYELPRFPINEKYGDLKRFQFLINLLPLQYNKLSPEDKLIKEQNLANLLRDIKKLKPKYQEVIQLRFFQEMSYKEIATQLGEPISNVKVKLLRAKKLLSEIITKS